MIHAALHRPVPVELTGDRRVDGRVRRLAAVSLLALGAITGLAGTGTDAPAAIVAMLAAGWLLMPLVLLASLRRPSLRYGLIVPSTLVSLGLIAIAVAWRPDDPVAAAGWLLMTVGVLLGGGMGAWFWFRLVPVPARLDDPVSPARWSLIAIHVGLIVAGVLLALASLATGGT